MSWLYCCSHWEPIESSKAKITTTKVALTYGACFARLTWVTQGIKSCRNKSVIKRSKLVLRFFVCLGLKRAEEHFGAPPKKCEFLGKKGLHIFCLEIFILSKFHSPIC